MSTYPRMSSIAACLVAIALPAAALAAGGAPAPSHEHSAPHALSLDAGRKWATDAPLRDGMARIDTALREQAHAASQGPAPPERYRALADTVEKEIAGIVANCKLPPAADANLHVIVAELVASVDAMRSDSPETRAGGARRARGALDDYGRFFDDPAFGTPARAFKPS